MKRVLLAFLAGLIVMGIGVAIFRVQPSSEPSVETTHTIGRTTRTIPVGEVVTGIHRLNRLVVFRAYVTATTTTHEVGWFTQTDQTMLTPANVNYFIDMDEVTAADVRVQADGAVVVHRPGVRIERPNVDTVQIQVFNDGLWSVLRTTADRLRVANSRMALKQLYARAQMPFLVDAARAGADAAVAANIQAALAAGGHPGMTVRVVR